MTYLSVSVGGQIFRHVQIPVLWGTRAILQDFERRLSVVELSGPHPTLEIVGDEPAPGVVYLPAYDGFKILENGRELYKYNPSEKTLTSISLELPECQINSDSIRVGSNKFVGNVVIGSPVGIVVTKEGIGMGASLPPGLAKMLI